MLLSVNLIDVTIQILKYITNFRNEIRSQIKDETAQIFRIKSDLKHVKDELNGKLNSFTDLYFLYIIPRFKSQQW